MKDLSDFQATLFAISIISLLAVSIAALFYGMVTDTVYNYGKRNSMILGFSRVIFSLGMLVPMITLLVGENGGPNQSIWVTLLVIEAIIAFLVELVALGDKLARRLKTNENTEKG